MIRGLVLASLAVTTLTAAAGDVGEGVSEETRRASVRFDAERLAPHAGPPHYEGETRGGERHGKGVMTWPDGRRYEGEWRGGWFHGLGVYTWPDGTRYEGEFRDNNIHGLGVFTEADGTRYEGEFRGIGKFQGSE